MLVESGGLTAKGGLNNGKGVGNSLCVWEGAPQAG